MLSTNFVMVCDERGTTRWPSSTKTWALGGFIIDSSMQNKVDLAWNDVKYNLCGDPSCELKWSHFFSGHHQEKGKNPLISNNPNMWRDQASWAISRIFEIPGIVPVNLYLRKNEASAVAFKKPETPLSKKYKVLDIDTIFIGIVGQFALFLDKHHANGEIWFDKLGSQIEEKRRQDSWTQLRDGDWKVNPENQKVIRRISSQLHFLDSRTNSLVQVADFISGAIWAASEGDDVFLRQVLGEYFPSTPDTFTLLRVT